MSRLPVLPLALVGALLLAGCGSGSDTSAGAEPLTKAEYQAKVGELVASVGARYGKVSVDPATLSGGEVAHAVTGLRELADQLEDVSPPAEVSDLHADYVAGLRAFADELPELTKELQAAKDPAAGLDVVLGSEGLQRLLRAAQGFGDRGYDLDLDGGQE